MILPCVLQLVVEMEKLLTTVIIILCISVPFLVLMKAYAYWGQNQLRLPARRAPGTSLNMCCCYWGSASEETLSLRFPKCFFQTRFIWDLKIGQKALREAKEKFSCFSSNKAKETEWVVLFHHATSAVYHGGVCGVDFYYLFIWAVWIGSSFALRWVLQAPCGSWWEVHVLICGLKSLGAPELLHTYVLLWGPPSCCASSGWWGLFLSHSTFAVNTSEELSVPSVPAGAHRNMLKSC